VHDKSVLTQLKTNLIYISNMVTMPTSRVPIINIPTLCVPPLNMVPKCILDLCCVFDSGGRVTGRLQAVFLDKTYSQISLEQFRYFIPKSQTFETENGIILHGDEYGLVGNLYEEMYEGDLSHTHREMTLLKQRYDTWVDAQKEIDLCEIAGFTSYHACFLEGEKKYAVVMSDMYPNLTKGSSFLRVVRAGDDDMERKGMAFLATIVSKYVSNTPREYLNIQKLSYDNL
jgi:hypothetical protein